MKDETQEQVDVGKQLLSSAGFQIIVGLIQLLNVKKLGGYKGKNTTTKPIIWWKFYITVLELYML